jgi:hypothetical protein
LYPYPEREVVHITLARGDERAEDHFSDSLRTFDIAACNRQGCLALTPIPAGAMSVTARTGDATMTNTPLTDDQQKEIWRLQERIPKISPVKVVLPIAWSYSS